MALQIVLHLPFLSLPPLGQHTWRQVMWAAPARNYYEEHGRFLFPQADVRIAPQDPGYLYHEFPLLVWLIGQSYRLTGEHEINGRLTMLVMGMVLLLASYRLMKVLGYSETTARWFVFFLAGAPEFFYYSITLEANLPALAWFVLGLTLLLPALRMGRPNWQYWAGMGLILLATLSKQTFLFFGLPVAYLFAYHYPRERRRAMLWSMVLAGLIVLVAHALIYRHTLSLYNHAPLERQAYWERKATPPPHSWSEAWNNLKPALTLWIPQLYINAAATPMFIAGLWVLAKRRRNNWEQRGFWLCWLASLAIFCVVFEIRLREHEYYLTPLLLLTAFASAVGAQWLASIPRVRWIALGFMVLVPVIMAGRIYPRWTIDVQVPDELLHHADELQALIPANARIIVVGDNSPVIYLYYLHRKGVSILPRSSTKYVRFLKGQGFNWAVSSLSLKAAPYLGRFSRIQGQIGRFRVIRIVQPGG
ncbi:MAG: ArnT family glycosyltransferase [SAR324 cluster bacterium]